MACFCLMPIVLLRILSLNSKVTYPTKVVLNRSYKNVNNGMFDSKLATEPPPKPPTKVTPRFDPLHDSKLT